MTDTPRPPGGDPPGPPTFSQEFQHNAVGARIPEAVARGVFSTGALILQGPTEFVLDFVLRMVPPQQVVARVVLPPPLLPQFIDALRLNLESYRAAFGPPPALPAVPLPARPPAIDEIYDQLKLPDTMLVGAYANRVQISHTPAEFCFDFIGAFYPRAAVAARVFLSAPQTPVLLNTLTQAWQTYQAKLKPPPA